MNEVENLKNAGNASFVAGDVKGAIVTYTNALEAMRLMNGPTTQEEGYAKLKGILHSNLSNAYITTGEFEKGAEAATAAFSADPKNVKAHLRYMEAKQRSGAPFESFVHLLKVLRPLLRMEIASGAMKARDASALVDKMELSLCSELGITRLSPAVELVDYAGGVAMVSRGHFAANAVVFAEKKYRTHLKETDLNVEAGLTTESIVLHFAEHLRLEQVAKSDMWKKFKRQFEGAWPRTPEDIDSVTRERVSAFLRDKLTDDINEEDFNELLVTSLMCRFNCFYAGFFRACALANHSCRANIAMKYSAEEDTVTMIAVSDIKPGELMNVKYLSDAHFLLGLGKRRELLRAWLFWCNCDRCAEDNTPASAVQEFVTCAACGKYTHYPIPTMNWVRRQAKEDNVEEVGNNADDPLFDTSLCCQHCQHSVAWERDKHDLLNHLIVSPPQGCTAPVLGSWLQSRLVITERLGVHPSHWIYRMIFYFYCLSLNGIVQKCMHGLRAPNGVGSVIASVRELLAAVGLHKQYLPRLEQAVISTDKKTSSDTLTTDAMLTSDDGGGCDALRCLRILWHLIVPFYPSYEMWAIHRMICDVVMMQLIFQAPSSSCRLSHEHALELLRTHGAYLGEQEAAWWVRLFNTLRPQCAEEKLLPTPAALKKVLGMK